MFETSDTVFAATISYVETRSALAAMRRAKRIRGVRARWASSELERVWRDLHLVRLDDRLVRLSGDTAERMRLRAGDAIQLTSALTVSDPGLVFATWDAELARAALDTGLAVAP
jgi:predicted nucleic acid-binding protein